MTVPSVCKAIAKVGDLVSVPSELFDDSPGSYSKIHPGKCFGTVSSITKKGIAKIIWVEDGSCHDCKLRDLTVEKRKSLQLPLWLCSSKETKLLLHLRTSTIGLKISF